MRTKIFCCYLRRRPRPFLTDESGGREADTPPPMPRIIIRAVGLVAVIKVKQDIIFYIAVLRIRDILGVRIRIRGSVPLTNGSGFATLLYSISV